MRLRLDPGTEAILAAARHRGIPVRRLERGLVQLGYGSCQRPLLDGQTDRTSALAAYVAEDCELTRELLRSVGVPVPEGRIVDNEEEAWEAALEIGLPVLVRPRDVSRGDALHKNLATREQVSAAFALVAGQRPPASIERFVVGRKHRLLVVGDRVVAALRQGVASTANYLDAENDSVRKNGSPHELHDGLPHAHVSASSGMAWFDVTDHVHPDVALHAVESARVVGLDLAGLEIIADDIARPLTEQAGAVVGVDARPNLGYYLEPMPAYRGRLAKPLSSTFSRAGPRPGAHRGCHRGQWQDHDNPADGAPVCACRSPDGHDLHRRHLHRRPPH